MSSRFVRRWRASNVARQICNYFLSERRLAVLRSRPVNIRIAVMSLLKDQPRHPYELMRKLRGRAGSAKSLFPVLQSLCDEGLVGVDVDFGWRTYWLTEAGEAELQAEGAEVTKVSTVDADGGPGSQADVRR
jgi:DNA-binding PadR family transcriptional regulator